MKENDRGVALVSGCSPRIFSMVMEGELNPYAFMLSVIDTERYAPHRRIILAATRLGRARTETGKVPAAVRRVIEAAIR